MEDKKSESLEVGRSVAEYFNEVGHIMENRASDIEQSEDNCGSWREHESD